MAWKLSVSSYETDQNSLTNSSNVQVKISVSTTNQSHNLNSNSAYIEGSIVGQNNTVNIPRTYFTINTNSTIEVLNANFGSFNHNADGSLEPVQINVYGRFTNSDNKSSITYCGMSTLTRASGVSTNLSDISVGSAVTININRASDNFTHELFYECGSINGSIASGVTTNTNWTIPTSFLNQFQNSSSIQCKIICNTYNNGNYIGNSTTYITIKPRSTDKSSFNLTVAEGTSALVDKGYGYLSGKSSLKITASSIALASGSSIKGYQLYLKKSDNTVIYAQGNDITASNNSLNISTPIISYIGSLKVELQLIDKRDMISSKTANITFNEYTAPTIKTGHAVRCTSQGIETSSGIYLKYTFLASIKSLNDNNTQKFEIGYKKSTDSNYTYKTISSSTDYTLIAKDIILNGVTFSADYVWDIQFRVTDAFEVTTVNDQLDTEDTLMNFNKSGNAIGFGRVSSPTDNKKLFEFAGKVDFQAGLSLNGIDLINHLFPIGKVEIFYDNNDHSKYLGFTWERLPDGVFPVNINPNDSDFNTIGKIGGSNEQTLSIDNIPEHYHDIRWESPTGSGVTISTTGSGKTALNILSWNWDENVGNSLSGSASNLYTNKVGSGKAFKIVPKNVVVAYWRRTN